LDLRIVDFGIYGNNRETNQEKSNAGSLRYMAPEILLGKNESSPKIDVFSLGVILYALLLGDYPFRGGNCKENLRKTVLEKEIVLTKKCGLSKDCRELIMKMLEKDPNTRYGISEIKEHPWI
jgi:serine/threonine protein kinase